METAVRKTGLLTAGRNPGDRTGPVCQPSTTEATTLLSKGSYPRPLECGSGPLPRAGVFLPECPQRSAAESPFSASGAPNEDTGCGCHLLRQTGITGCRLPGELPRRAPLQGHTAALMRCRFRRRFPRSGSRSTGTSPGLGRPGHPRNSGALVARQRRRHYYSSKHICQQAIPVASARFRGHLPFLNGPTEMPCRLTHREGEWQRL